jgi:hypothetical protein
MIKDAGSLLALADSHPELKSTLAACASLIVAVALDQGTKTVLSSVISAEDDPRQADCRELMKPEESSLRRRVTRLPVVLTGGRYSLRSRSPHVDALHDLITLRNVLMHVNEDAKIQHTSIPWPVPDGFQLSVSTSLPSTKWFSVTPEKANAYRAAVELYAEEVLFPPSGEIQSGKLVGAGI